MDQGVTVCEYLGHLVNVTPASDFSVRQLLAGGDVPVFPTLTLPSPNNGSQEQQQQSHTGSQQPLTEPDDDSVSSVTVVSVLAETVVQKAQSISSLLWDLKDLPLSHWIPTSLLPNSANTQKPRIDSDCLITTIAFHPSLPLIALASSTHRIYIFDFRTGKYLVYHLEIPYLPGTESGVLQSLAFSRGIGLIATTQDGSCYHWVLDISGGSNVTARSISLFPRSSTISHSPPSSNTTVGRSSLRTTSWLDTRYLVVAGLRGTLLYDMYTHETSSITNSSSFSVAVSSCFIAIQTASGIEVMSFGYPIRISQSYKIKRGAGHEIEGMAFVSDRVLLYGISFPVVDAEGKGSVGYKVCALQVRATSRCPEARTLEAHDVPHRISSITVSGTRVLVASDFWVGLLVVAVEPGRIIWREVGEVFGPRSEAGEKSRLIKAVPLNKGMLHDLDNGGAILGFGLLWSLGLVTILGCM